MITTLVIAAAGRGTRMQHLSQDKPKHLVEVRGKPFLHYILESAQKAGFQRVIIVVGYQKEKIQEFIAHSPFEVELVDQEKYVGNKYGTSAVVEVVEHLLAGQAFVSHNGDGLFLPQALQQAMKNDNFFHLFAQPFPVRKGLSEVRLDPQGMMLELVPTTATVSCLTNTGLYTLQPKVFDLVKTVPISVRGEYEITDVFNVLCQQHQVKAHILHDAWIELGRPENIPQVEKFLVKYHYV
ncbi:MAG: hypothetical protein A2233_01095 [Candidatus Kerfeldbacteria bacterium RIFOXYA2_FULL_38_24]|uniref:Nucleotidyl transferase domain-containing protein n=1 Tax=Candidatus Kerfeldbacteria bacterium RIFOXYB2_FULL_38_14 TaxID=1798547 RepID=A0A1G2BBE2_9BACT|nr:MAG: hypothetical protein A2233_01095 [Candidatus Kerfeldbacteria bacterium RIFOXYA2_FULL_38_24]OGY86533.1 MAG: hypothetical protein A2319_02085 [Candidatus Kerfeldbacteria bacterium RIFOXYB2_FULL_38_14]OGY89264.1 MAG: hypothetical protein A2458_00790 [Candidatus Kerfeldbacteria bacterium RIFOXYC2_FULL_38_9]